jgi:hypothetical protein
MFPNKSTLFRGESEGKKMSMVNFLDQSRYWWVVAN